MFIRWCVIIGPLTPLTRRRPEDIGLMPDGASDRAATDKPRRTENVVDRDWASVEWTLVRAIRTSRFWWIVLGYFCALFALYAVQVHQTEYLIEAGFTPLVAAWSLGIVSVVAIPGQIGLGALSDRVGREWVWTVA
jgi:sugar phosphate permease